MIAAMARRLCFILHAWFAACGLASGSFECPCINNSSEGFAQLREKLPEFNVSNDYGLDGCKAYDVGHRNLGCARNALSFCSKSWCYVDVKLCRQNDEKCKDEGDKPGSRASPHCRSRPHVRSNPLSDVTGTEVFYSYETCGNINSYSDDDLFKVHAGNVVAGAVLAWPPWVVHEQGIDEKQSEFRGPEYNFFQHVLNLFDPDISLNVTLSGYTNQSVAITNDTSGGYSACVYDVAVGNYDVCIADLWITPERRLLTTFLPPLREDTFYLVVKRKPSQVAGFLFGFGILMWLTKENVRGKSTRLGSLFRKNRSITAQNLEMTGAAFQALCRIEFETLHSFLSGAPQNYGTRLFRMAFSFFILVTLVSYTASLASMLVIVPPDTGEYQNIDEAIDRHARICVPDIVKPAFEGIYPGANFVEGQFNKLHHMLERGECTAMVVTQDIFDQIQGGFLGETDTANETGNEAGSGNISGQETKGNAYCDLFRVGDVLYTLPVSFPISQRFVYILSWAVTYAQEGGWFEKEIAQHADIFPERLCDFQSTRKEGTGMVADDVLGCFFISLMFVGFGIVIMLVISREAAMGTISKARSLAWNRSNRSLDRE
ncbi:unnamed protein product [Durusdinium trenchii]|uniref:Ionotropic glutamate receptor C-terminal domain-containing protein n=1 Tax=Durusdinium trenchii TaxID=1381693 RepID=A0ABP0I8G2_9DINO